MVSSGCGSARPALATRGFDTEDFVEVATSWPRRSSRLPRGCAARPVDALVAKHPLYPGVANFGREHDRCTAGAAGLALAHPEPKRSYDVVIVGAGGHGLATA